MIVTLGRTINTANLGTYRSQNLFIPKSVLLCTEGKRNASCSQCLSDIHGKSNLQTAKGWQLFQENQGVYLHLHQILSLPEHHEYL